MATQVARIAIWLLFVVALMWLCFGARGAEGEATVIKWGEAWVAGGGDCVHWPAVGKTTHEKLVAYHKLEAEEKRVKAKYPACREDVYSEECEASCSRKAVEKSDDSRR